MSGLAGGVARFGVLGPLTFERDGLAVAVPSGRQRSLLALLLLGGGVPLSRDRLIDELWGDRPPPSAVSALHVHLSKLRALLGGLLVLDSAGYALPAGEFELDAWHFDELVEQARGDPGRAHTLLRDALALFRGEPLSDVAAEGSVAQWRRALEEKRLQAILMRIDADLERGAAAELVPELERLAAEHPFEERVSIQLMLALHRAGRQADALDAYQRTRRRLAEELGLDPGEQLRDLHQRILDRDPALLAATPPAETSQPTTDAPGASSNLPRPVTRLVGRVEELRALDGLMADPDVRLVTLTGPGGVGKTRLLLELASRHEHQYADGAVFVRLEQVTDPALVAAEVASAIAQRDGTEGPGADALPNYLRDRELLLVIDNFEHLTASAILPAELLGIAPRLRVLVSSRTPLRIRGEQVFEVDPLGLPADETEHEALESPAVQMFLQCALASNRNLEVDATFTRTVAAICRALDGLPLAIELAASRASVLAPAQIAEQLAQPLSIGRRALRDLPDRQQSLGTTIRWSYDLLTPAAREVFLSAGVFLGGFDAEALAATVGRSPGAELDELLETSLFRRRADGRRFEQLELVRVFAVEELARAGELEPTRARHRAYFAAQVSAASEALDAGTSPGEAAAPLLADHANVRAALENSIDAGDQQSATALALGLRAVWFAGMLRQESQELVGRLLERFSIPAEEEMALLRAVSFVEGFSPVVSTWTRRMVARAAELGDTEALATATGNLFGRAINARDREEMRRLRPMLQAVLAPGASAKALGWTHYFLALDAYVDGRFEDAHEHATSSAASASELGHAYMFATAAATRLLAESARDRAIPQSALAEVVELVRNVSVPPLAAFVLWFVARYAAAVAPDGAAQWLAHAERIMVSIDSELWPESILRDECLAVLSVAERGALLEGVAALDHATALTEAAAWLATRDPSEQAARDPVGQLTFASE
ncbi:MAG TPA: BTAD domain-containing putative transcriptional regulator [Solirubrobacteraceae bacterium]|nr:BTAD domain-containing putative transcriptional regulator [Solirubrobacteraceae bacterium]